MPRRVSVLGGIGSALPSVLQRWLDHERPVVLVSEVKFKKLSAAERRQLEGHLADGWQRSTLSQRYRKVTFEILDLTSLGKRQG